MKLESKSGLKKTAKMHIQQKLLNKRKKGKGTEIEVRNKSETQKKYQK